MRMLELSTKTFVKSAGIPIMKVRSMKFEPIKFPMARLYFFFFKELMVVTISGIEDPNAIAVPASMTFGMFNADAIVIPYFTVKSARITTEMPPIAK